MATNIVGATGIDKVQDGIIVNADIDTVAASKLTGALPAISGASLTNLPTTDISGKLNLSGGTMTGNLTLNGADIIKSGSADLTIDIGGRINLSADDNGEIRLYDGSSLYAQFKDDDDRFRIEGLIADKDIMFIVNDGGVATTAINIDAASGGDTTIYKKLSCKETQINKSNTTFATNGSTSASEATLTVKTHSGDSTVTTLGGISGGTGYIQRSNGGGTGFYGLDFNPYGGNVHFGGVNDAPWNASNATSLVSWQAGNGQLWSVANNTFPLALNRTGSSSDTGNIIKFYFRGTITGDVSTTTSGVSYNTGSDYRLKENVDYTWDATTRLKQLKPARFNFIADDTNTLVDGFIAHEVSSVVPEAITGEKDATEMQGIDQSKLVPLLVKTIQELEARLTAGGL